MEEEGHEEAWGISHRFGAHLRKVRRDVGQVYAEQFCKNRDVAVQHREAFDVILSA